MPLLVEPETFENAVLDISEIFLLSNFEFDWGVKKKKNGEQLLCLLPQLGGCLMPGFILFALFQHGLETKLLYLSPLRSNAKLVFICVQRLRLSRLLDSFAWHWLRSLLSRLSRLAQGLRSLLTVFCLCLFGFEYSSLREPFYAFPREQGICDSGWSLF
jgi:hypothetical protein